MEMQLFIAFDCLRINDVICHDVLQHCNDLDSSFVSEYD